MEHIPDIRFKGFNGEWEERKLGEVCSSLSYGLNAAAKEFDGEHKYIRITDIDDDTRIYLDSNITSPDTDFAQADEYQLRESDILFARTGASVGKTCLYRNSYGLVYYAGFLIRGRVTPEYNAEFIFQNTLTKKYANFIRLTSQRSGQPGVNAQEYAGYEFPCPNLAEQTQIGEFLHCIDNLTNLYNRKCEELTKLKKYMLQKLFPKKGEKYPEIRFEGFTDAWEECRLGELVQFSKGIGYSKADIKEKGTPLILYGRLYTKYETVISDVDTFADERPASVYSKGGEVIVPASGETAEDISIASVVKKSGILLGGDLNIITPPVTLDSAFLAISISNGKPHEDMARMAQGKSIVHLHNTDLEKIELLYPEYSEQFKISSYFQHLDHLITLHQRKYRHLIEFKNYMLQNMFPKDF